MARVITLPKPHAGQLKIARVAIQHPRVVLRCGRRWGKSTMLECLAAKRALRGQRVGWFGPQYRLNTPTYSRISRMLTGVRSRQSKIDQVIELATGGCIEFWTLSDPDAGRSRFYDLAIIDEGSLVPRGLQDIWEQSIAPTLLDKQGAAIMAGTPKGIDSDNYFYRACTSPELKWSETNPTGWLEFHAPTSDNPTLDREAVERLKDQYPALVYQQEYLAEFVDWSGAAFFDVNLLLVDGKPLGELPKPDQIFLVVDTAMKDGAEHDGTACILFAVFKHGQLGDTQLAIIDYDIINIDAHLLIKWLPAQIKSGQEFANFTGARQGFVGAWIEDAASGIALIGEARSCGMPVEAIDTKLTSLGKEGRALAVSRHYASGKVKITQHAFDKAVRFREMNKNHLIDQLAAFRIGMKRAEHRLDLVDCLTYGLSIALGDSEGW